MDWERVERRLKIFSMCLLAVFLSVCILVPLCTRSGSCSGGRNQAPVFINDDALEALEFTEDYVYAAMGGSVKLPVRTQPEVYDGVLTWSSSDARVLRIGSDGTVTICGSGTVEVTVSYGSLSDVITVFVTDDILVEASECIRALSEGCSREKLDDVDSMLDKLAHSAIVGAEEARNAIKNIIAYIDGGDSAALEQSVSAANLDGTLCRTAAVSCWAYGEQQRSDGVISFCGDCTLARFNGSSGKGRFPSVYNASGSLTYPFDRVRAVFACDDLTLINLEGTLTDSKDHLNKTYYFSGSPDYARILPASSIEAANLANNHTGDYGVRGYEDTLRNLYEVNVSAVDEGMPMPMTVGEKRMNVIFLSASCVGKDYYEDIREDLLAAVRRSKDEDTVVVVSLHWGTEGADTPSDRQITAAHELVNAGADLIVGHHSHVMQGIELYNGRYIAYSLGNFAFGGNGRANSPETLILRAQIGVDRNGISTVTGISVVPCLTTSTGTEINNYQPMLCFGDEGDAVYETLLERSRAIGGVTEIARPDV